MNAALNVAERAMRRIGTHFDIDPVKIKPEHTFENNFYFDSLDMVELAMIMEDEFDCEIDDDKLASNFSVQQLIDLIVMQGVVA